ncbi:MAG: hypothetical protein ACK5RG_18965 [Cyclobacteriaceae bacterium]|jgi:hypothetical protein|nr:hypothetical protein [Flammeovirgaceae bacterium]
MIKFIQILAFIALSNALFAQTFYVPQTIRTPQGNVTIQHPVYHHMNYGNYNGQINLNAKFEFTITLENDSIITFKSRFESADKKMYVVQKIKGVKREIFPGETKEVIAYSSNYGRIKGIPADSCWYFKAHSGAINSYTILPMNNRNDAIAIQQGDNAPIIPLTKTNLIAITGSDDPKIAKWLSKNKLAEIITYYNEQERKKNQPANN